MPLAEFDQEPAPAPKTKAAKDDLVTITVRMPRAKWKRIKTLAMNEGTTITDLAMRGFSMALESKGLKPL